MGLKPKIVKLMVKLKFSYKNKRLSVKVFASLRQTILNFSGQLRVVRRIQMQKCWEEFF